MTTIESNPDALAGERAGSASASESVSGSGSLLASVADWVTTSDHKRIGRLFIGTSLVGLVATAVLGLLLGIERTDSSRFVFDAGSLPQMFQAYRVGLVFVTMLPLGIGLAIAVVPLQLGARALAFPRLALAGFYGWLAGAVLVAVALANDGGIGGTDADMAALFLLGHALMALGLTAAAGTIATSVLTTRAPGMTMRRVPLFTWSTLVGALGLLLVLPVMVGTIIYLVIDLRHGATTFGGSAGIGTWLSWPFTHPTIYLFALPALGVAAELVPVTFRRAQIGRGVVFAGLALVGVAAFAGVTQQSLFALPWEGSGLNFDGFEQKFRDLVPFAMFNVVPLLGVVIVMALGALCAAGGRPRITAPFLFAFFGLGMVSVGMVGGVLHPIDDLGLRGTVFEEAVVVYVAYGSVLGVLGGLLFWAPKLWGRRIPEMKAIPLALLGVLATVLASLPYYVAGFADQPAGAAVFSISGPDSLWSILVLVGHGLMLLTVLGVAGLALASFTGDEPDADDPSAAGDDPWGAHTIEWSAPSPAPGNNYAEVPSVHSAEPMLDLSAGSDAGSAGGATTDGSSS